MLDFSIILRLLLAGVFVLAGWTKLRNPAHTRQDFDALGLPPRIVPALGICLPLLEGLVGALLFYAPTASLGAAFALGLLVVFTLVIGVNLWRGRRPTCACFGVLTRTRIGAHTVFRNVGLMGVAALLFVPVPTFTTGLVASSQVLALAPAFVGIVVMACLFGVWWVFQLWRQQGRLLLRIEQLEQLAQVPIPAATPQPVSLPRASELAGQPAPALTLHDVTGRRLALQSLQGSLVVLMFLDATCQHCRRVLSRLSTWQPAAQVIVVLAGAPPSSLDVAPGIMVVTNDASSAMQAFGVFSTPSAIIIDAAGRVAEPAAKGNAAVAQLMDCLNEVPQAQEVQHELASV